LKHIPDNLIEESTNSGLSQQLHLHSHHTLAVQNQSSSLQTLVSATLVYIFYFFIFFFAAAAAACNLKTHIQLLTSTKPCPPLQTDKKFPDLVLTIPEEIDRFPVFHDPPVPQFICNQNSPKDNCGNSNSH